MQCYFFVPGKPRGKGRPRFYHGHAVTDVKTRDYEGMVSHKSGKEMQSLRALFGEEFDKLKDVPCRVELQAFFLVPKSYSRVKRECALNGFLRPGKPDADNIIKAILDGMNGVVFNDDAQVYDVSCEKRYSDCIEGVEVVVHWRTEK